MNTWRTDQDYPVQAGHALGRLLADRRRLLGLLLIASGSLWLGLRLAGLDGDLPLPVAWLVGLGHIGERFGAGDLLLSGAQAVCGMLGVYAIYRSRADDAG